MTIARTDPKHSNTSIIRRIVSPLLKVIITVLAFYLLLSHKVQMIDHRSIETVSGQAIELKPNDMFTIGDREFRLKSGSDAISSSGSLISLKTGQHIKLTDGTAGRILPIETRTTFSAIVQFLPTIRIETFWLFVCLATLIKFIGILSSMYRWQLLLKGQGIAFPFRHIFGSFLIGRFLGTFLPSTIGLDGYKLYDASRFSHRVVECTAATAIEKILGILGIFITFLVALPLGSSILGPRASQIIQLTVPLAIGLIIAFLLLLFFPAPIQRLISVFPFPGKARIQGFVLRVSKSAAAYRDHKLLLINALFQSFSVHFCTAAMYYFTARAIGAVGADFWQVTFASSIQIFATVITPITIAGEGIREIAQYYLLRNQIGPAAAIVSAALGFWAAEALTLLGGVFWWLRRKSYRPAFLFLDNVAVDIDSLMKSDDYGLEELVKHPASPSGRWRINAIFSRVIDGLSAGLIAGAAIGLAEALWIMTIKGGSLDVFLFAVVSYGLIGSLFGIAAGFGIGAIAVLFGYESHSVHTYPMIFAGWFSANLFILGRFRLFRDIWKEQPLPMNVKLILGLTSLLALIAVYYVINKIRSRSKHPHLLTFILFTTLLIVSTGLAVMYPSTDRPIIPSRAQESASANRPNIILIMCDALRADALGTYGCKNVHTPIIDSLANDGTRFDRAYANASWTKPGTACIMSGLYPSGHKTYLKPDILPDSINTLAERLKSGGYYTIGFANNINISDGFNFGQGYDEYHYLAPDYFFHASETSSLLSYYSILRLIRERFLVKSKFPENYYQEAEIVNQRAGAFLQRNPAPTPFFLYLHYMEPHDPYFVHPFNGIGYARVDMPDPPPEMAEKLRKTYYGEIDYLDQKLGALFELLKTRNLWDDTIILLTSDHGEEFYDHGGWWHGTTLYEEQIRIPLIWKHVRNAQHEPVRTDLVQQVDIAPTILALCNLDEQNSDLPGRDVFGSNLEEKLPVFAEEDHEGNILTCVIEDFSKLITANSGNPRGLPEQELFQLDSDPGELHNRINEAPEQVESLRERIKTLQERAAARGHIRETREITDEDLDRMKSLGYVEN